MYLKNSTFLSLKITVDTLIESPATEDKKFRRRKRSFHSKLESNSL